MSVIEAPASGVNVRMYRPGFGDCFLLTFRDRQGQPVHCLIDCGVHSQWAQGSNRIRNVVEHLGQATDHHLHLVVLTHEHADHVSGFHHARATFGQMTVDQVWAAWTEDPDNKQARALDKKKALMLRSLRAVGPHLAAMDDKLADHNVGQAMGFFDIPAGKKSFAVSTRDARDAAFALTTHRKYLKPNTEPIEIPGVADVRAFVLGPPLDEKLLLAARPTTEPDEVYASDEVHAAPKKRPKKGQFRYHRPDDRDQPFAGNYRIPEEWVQANSRNKAYRFFHELYGFKPQHAHAWRRLDREWTAAAEEMAIKLDGATNNSSLVLAIELRHTGRVLLFPGDAQVGNWKSWHECRWDENNGLGSGELITAADLLKRTVLYKVAHHGSHNATLKKLGLEMMTSPELTAMIPVDQMWAEDRRPHRWMMPFSPMYEDLMTRTGGRILRTDLGLVSAEEEIWKPREVPTVDDLYVDLHIPDE